MGTSAKASKKNAYDPARQWGLKPESEAPGATYVVSGHVVSSSDMRSMYSAENMGREAQAKAVRKVAAADADKVLEKLLARDKEGTKALSAARAFSKRRADEVKQEGKGKAKGISGKPILPQPRKKPLPARAQPVKPNKRAAVSLLSVLRHSIA